MELELLHFCYSPYNEKVRWALDIKKLPHRRTSLLPGPHMRKLKKLTGQTATPIMRLGNDWIAGSADILIALDELSPEPRLLPRDVDDLAKVLQIQKKFDENWGPLIRRVVITSLMEDLGKFAKVFAGHKGAFERLSYRAALPIVKPLIAKSNGITGPKSIEAGKIALREAMEFVGSHDGYLAGDRLSAADIAAASTLSSVLEIPGTPMERPIILPILLRQMNDRWGMHDGTNWVRRIFDRHRGSGMPADGEIVYSG